MSPPSARKILAVVTSSVTMALLAMAATGQPLPGRCDDLGLPGPCTADECQLECRGMGGDSTRASCNSAGKCCCPARNALVCEHYDHCRDRIDGCRKCENDWALSPAGAYCKDGSGNVRDSCCCRPNATVAVVDGDVDHRHRRIHLHY